MRSTSHLAGVRTSVADVCPLGYFLARRACHGGLRMRVLRFMCYLIDAAAQSVSSHNGRTSNIRKAVSAVSENARAWRIALRMSSGSYSGLAMHDFVQ